MKQMIGKIGLLLVAIIWGTGFVWTAIALEHFGPYEIIAIRMTIAFFFFFFLNIHRLNELTRVNLPRGSFVGLLLYLGFIFQTIGLSYTTPSNNAFLTAVNIVFVPFISLILLRRTISFQSIWGALVTFVGIGFISLQSGLSNMNRGDVFSLICAVFFALQIVATDIFTKKMPTWQLLLSQIGTASLLAWIGVFTSGETNLVDGSVPLNGQTLFPLVYLGLVGTLFAYYIQTYSQKTTSSTETAVILSTEAFFGMIGSVLVLHEVVTFAMIVGGILIFCGILIVEIDFLQFRQVREKIASGFKHKKENNHPST